MVKRFRSVRVTAETYKKIRRLSEEHGLSISEFVSAALQDFMDNHPTL